jgi:hypothetical protein
LPQKSEKVKEVKSEKVNATNLNCFCTFSLFHFFTKIKNRTCSNKCGIKSFHFGECEQTSTKLGERLLPATALDHLFIFRYLIKSFIGSFFPKVLKLSKNNP